MATYMARQSRFDLADLILDGELEQILRAARLKNVSFDDIALNLRLRGIEVTGETVRQWCIQRDVPAPERAAS